MKATDVMATGLLIIGGLNWGLVGFFGVDLVAALFGEASVMARTVYVLVGLSAAYQGLQWKAIQRRWRLQPALG
jgi:uncharacterized protein